MQAALREFIVHGVITNIDFLQAVLSHPDFANGEVTTRWVETSFNWTPPSEPSSESLVAAGLADLTIVNRQPSMDHPDEPDPYSPWKTASGFRMGGNNG
jgi:pyruvate carboxylase